MSANGMVRPCSRPASQRSWQGAPKVFLSAESSALNCAQMLSGRSQRGLICWGSGSATPFPDMRRISAVSCASCGSQDGGEWFGSTAIHGVHKRQEEVDEVGGLHLRQGPSLQFLESIFQLPSCQLW